ncbi:hypothetical protein AJ80_01973 [Polytolypa hystricis UAMH7299]|uniref:Zn(2)-C6 fungal-type domain-containing protein n=1 Tax=Polytolypa hystricis (strain UAMH7299) TaxID=1447883 RepID=A0A2B7YS88_POLH7|nr:hypothetical protein AJ80_01973 [Polytolypa hystricis UAMH7299]
MPPRDSGREPSKRDKYTIRACNECQRRKVKCSGEQPCLNCRNRQSSCKYSTGTGAEPASSRRPAKRARTDPDPRTLDPGPDVQSTASNHRRSIPRSESSSSSRSGSESLREKVQQLQNRMDVLLCSRSLESPSPGEEIATATLSQLPSEPKLFPQTDNAPKQSPRDGKPEVFPDCEQFASNLSTADSASPSGETDTFEQSSRWPSALAVSSKISALRSSVGREATRRYEASPPINGRRLFITLPPPARLVYLLKVFFEEFDCNFPCLIEVNVRKRLSEAFRKLQYSKHNRRVPVNAQHYKTVAILCNALAYSETSAEPLISPCGATSEVRPDWTLYLQGRQLMQHTEMSGEDDIDFITYHVTSAAYTLRAEMLRLASNHVLHGFQAALNASLNNQDRWHTAQLEFAPRKALWWTLYFLDKRIAQKSGIAYFIRESEVAVSDFRGNPTESQGDEENDAPRRELLQNMVIFSKLWTHIWDNFFAPGAPIAGKWDEVQIMDARITVSQQQTPTRLLWTPELVDESVKSGEAEPQIRKRLLVYLRYQVLRLTIRHGSLASPSIEHQRRRSCFLIAKDILESISKYMSLYPAVRGSGYLLTSSLVEALYYIVPEFQRHSTSLDPRIVRNTLRKASSLLHTLSHTVGAATRALEALSCVLLIDESMPGELSSASYNKHYLALPNPLQSSIHHRGPENMPDQAIFPPDDFWMYDREGTSKVLYGGVENGRSFGNNEQSSTSSGTSAAAMQQQEADPPWIGRAPTKPLAPDSSSYSSPPKPFQTSGLESRNTSFQSDFLFNLDGGWGVNESESLDYCDLDLLFFES